MCVHARGKIWTICTKKWKMERKTNRHFFIRSHDIHMEKSAEMLGIELYTELSTLSTCFFGIILWNYQE